MAKSNWDIKGAINKYEQAVQDGLRVAIAHLSSESLRTAIGERGEALKARKSGQLKDSFKTELEGLKGYVGNITDYYIYVHYGTSEGKPGKTQPRPILTLVLDRNTNEVKRIIQKAINSV